MTNSHGHLHDGERLLANLHASKAMLVAGLCRALLDALVLSIVTSIVALAAGWFAFGVLPAWYVYVLIVLASYALAAWMRWKFWKESDFVVTTERILFHYRHSLFAEPMHTVKWAQFQEGFVQRKNILEVFFGGHAIGIRYGTADAQHVASFPSIPYANDLKHYLDKVDSAVRGGSINDIRPFVLKPKGRRDE